MLGVNKLNNHKLILFKIKLKDILAEEVHQYYDNCLVPHISIYFVNEGVCLL